jgi:ATP-dependent DNA helicase RecG
VYSLAMPVTELDLRELIEVPKEGAHIEFKEARTQYDFEKVLRYCVAFANEGGGTLLLGVTNNTPREIVGTRAFKSPIEFQKDLFNKLHFRIEVEEVETSDGRVLVISAPSRPKGMPVHVDGAYWMRSGDQLVAMTPEQLRKIFEEGKPDWLSEVALEDITDDQVVALLDTQGFFDLFKRPYPESREGVLNRLESERLIKRSQGGWSITNLAAILFGKRLDKFGPAVARKAPRVIVYEGRDKLKTRLDKPGTKGYAVAFEGILEFINSQIPTNEVIETALRTEAKMFPEAATRELVANALIHQDFEQTGTSVVVEIYSDRMEVSNPGQPFISPERFIDEYQSRNERLAELMRRVGICEEKGSGIDRVILSAEAYQLPAPDFRVSDLRTTAVLFSHMALEDMDRNDKVRACYQHCCLRYVMNERMTNQSLRERFQLSEQKAELASRIIRDTLDAGKIKLEDPTNTSKRYARYVPFWA